MASDRSASSFSHRNKPSIMSPEDDLLDAESQSSDVAEEQAPAKLNLDVKIEPRGACQRHITVTIAREDIERYFNDAFSELMSSAAVPGFRAGRAPRKLVEARYRKDVVGQVKGSLLVDSMSQVTEDHNLAAISEPDFDAEAIEVPDEGPMTFEFGIEVRPEFDLPQWKGLSVERPVREISKADIDRQLERTLASRGRLVPCDRAAQPGDYIVTNLTFQHDGVVISSAEEEVIRLRPVLSFRDGRIEKFDTLMKGVRGGETREAQALLSADAPNVALRGQKVTAVFDVLEVKQLELPEITPQLLSELGDFADEGSLRDAVRDSLERRLQYEQQRRARQQVLAALTVAADWDLPPDLLERQSNRELQRAILELRRSGFSDDEIRAHVNDLRQNSRASTARALKEHFILERIAEAESIDAEPVDYEVEVILIAQQTGDSPRRVRAQLEKRGLMDSLRNQIIERKVIDLILSHAKFKDVPFEWEEATAEALDQSAGGDDEEEEGAIPTAQHPDEAQPLRALEDHT